MTWIKDNYRLFALGALLSLFSLVSIPTGDPQWLGFTGYLGFLAVRIPEPRQSRA
jgi:hypothetical protein